MLLFGNIKRNAKRAFIILKSKGISNFIKMILIAWNLQFKGLSIGKKLKFVRIHPFSAIVVLLILYHRRVFLWSID